MELHEIQNEILKELAFNESARFGDFVIKKSENVESDRFNYHLQALVKNGYVTKSDKGEYRIDKLGKDYINTKNLDGKVAQIKMPKVNVLVLLFDESGKKVLLAKRLKHPFKNQVGFISGKVEYGETFEEAVSRELTEESGLIAKEMTHIAIRRCIDFSAEKEVLHDSVYFIYWINEYQGTLEKATLESKNIWFSLDELKFDEILPVTAQVLKEYKEKGDTSNNIESIPFYNYMTSVMEVY